VGDVTNQGHGRGWKESSQGQLEEGIRGDDDFLNRTVPGHGGQFGREQQKAHSRLRRIVYIQQIPVHDELSFTGALATRDGTVTSILPFPHPHPQHA